MALNKTLQAGTKARDASERAVDVPPELEDALRGDALARAAFEKLAYSHRKEYAVWVGGAKKSETRATRARKALDMLRAGSR